MSNTITAKDAGFKSFRICTLWFNEYVKGERGEGEEYANIYKISAKRNILNVSKLTSF